MKARNDVPMEVRHLIAETREIDLVGCERRAQRRLDREHHAHEAAALGVSQIRHLANMAVEDHPAEGRVIAIADEDDATKIIAPYDLAAVGAAEVASEFVGGRVRHGRHISGSATSERFGRYGC